MENQNNEMIDKIKNILLEVGTNEDIQKVTIDAQLEKDLGIDSFGALEALFSLEQEFGITISDRDFSKVRTVQDVVEHINTILKGEKIKENKKKDFLENLRIDKSEAEKLNFNPYYKLVQSNLDRKILIEGKELISLGSNDYLGLANDQSIKERAKKVLEKYGISMCGTPIVVGQTDINRELEVKIAEFLKQEDALVFPSGFQANIGVFKTLCDSEDIIIADKSAHSSLIEGALMSNASLRFFPFNDTSALQEILKVSQDYRMRFIVVEGLYSTEGASTPLDVVTRLAKEYNAFIILDDAHGVGVLGREGRGVMEKFGIYEADLISGSLGKAIGCFGGFLAGKEKIIDFFRYRLPSYIYSTALPPSVAAGALSSIDLIPDLTDRREKIEGFKEKLYKSLNEMGYNLTPATSPLFSVIFENTGKTLEVTKALFERGVYGTPFLPPSVPKESPRIRLIPTANLQEEDIDEVIKIFEEIKDLYL
jgi:8-amino-7-oxononanoate synthase/acyl carrier protein